MHSCARLLPQMTICKNIVRGNIVFPEFVTDPGAKDIIRLLLVKYVLSASRCAYLLLCNPYAAAETYLPA